LAYYENTTGFIAWAMTCTVLLADRGVPMKITRLVLPACILLLAAGGALADSHDPKIVMGGGGSCQSFIETSLTQTFTGVETASAPDCPSGLVDFTNEINDGTVTLDLLVVNVDTPFTGVLSCAGTRQSPQHGSSAFFADFVHV
jgi:hypothetical protein